MARMKFLCDADRCIECNACVTACKNEHEVPWGINRRRVVTINDGKPGERSVSMACMHCTDAPCQAVCPTNAIYTTADGVVLHSKDICIGCGYCFYACPFGAPQYPKVSNFGSRGKMDKCTYCAGGPEADGSKEEYEKYGTCSSAAMAPAPGAGRRRTARPSRHNGITPRHRAGHRAVPIHRHKRDDSTEGIMAMLFTHARFIVAALALALAVFIAAPASAQQRNPDNSVNPTASSVKEDQLLQQLSIISGRGTIPDVKSYNIEQPAGRDWRQFHQVTLRWIGAIAILGILAVLVIFYLIRGMVRLETGRSGRVLVRFSGFERLVHWMTATCFVILAISGLNITFGKSLLAPLMAPETFTAWSQWAKYAHNYLSFPFALGVVLIFLMWIGGNVPNKVDVEWLKRGGGIVGHDHPPADRFNAGQKMIYWIVVLGGGAVAVSGYVLMFPFYGTTIAGMQVAQIIHGTVAVLFVAAMLGHIYIGTIGMEGAFEAMWDGTVDANWAKEHHSLWLEKEAREGSAPPSQGRMAPAE